MIYKIKNHIIQANEVVFSTLLAVSITLVYHWYYLKSFLPFLDNKKLVEFRLPVRDGDYYLLTIERLGDVFRSVNPFTYSAITPQLNLHFAELIYFLPYSLGLSIESSYLVIQVMFTGLLLFTLSKLALNILQVKWIVTLFTSAFTFLVFPEVFVRPVSPMIHATFLFAYLYLVWIILMKQRRSRPLLTNLLGLIVGIGYPYFA